MPRKKKQENLVHLDLDEMSKPAPNRRQKVVLEQATADPSSLGGILEQARLNKKLKLEDVAQKLRIREIYLKSLEQGQYYTFPALVYGVGFLRSYANFLGLNATELVERFQQETSGIQTEDLNMPVIDRSRSLPSKKTVFKSLGILFLIMFLWNLVAAFMTDETVEFNSTPSITTVQEPVIVDETKIVTDTSAPNNNPEPVVAEQPAPKKETPKPEPKVYGLKTPARVSFVATKEVWIEVKDTEADHVLLSKVLQPGDKYNPSASTDGMVLKVANAGAVTVFVDGNDVGPLGKKGQMRSGILMNAEDLLKD